MNHPSQLPILDINAESEWLNSKEAAEYLRIFRKKDGKPCAESIRNLTNQGKLPYYKPFGKLLFSRSELKKIVERSGIGTIRGY